MTDQDWIPFTHRYGIATFVSAWPWGFERWRSRHSAEIVAGDEANPLFQCVCPGSALRREDPPCRCAIRATQEDRLCDPCRRWCVAIDQAGRYHRFVDLYGAMT